MSSFCYLGLKALIFVCLKDRTMFNVYEWILFGKFVGLMTDSHPHKHSHIKTYTYLLPPTFIHDQYCLHTYPIHFRIHICRYALKQFIFTYTYGGRYALNLLIFTYTFVGRYALNQLIFIYTYVGRYALNLFIFTYTYVGRYALNQFIFTCIYVGRYALNHVIFIYM